VWWWWWCILFNKFHSNYKKRVAEITACDTMDRYQKTHFTEPINNEFQDPFWYKIYRPLFLERLEEKRRISAASRDRIAYGIDSYLQHLLKTCVDSSRSEAHLHLMNVKSELGDGTNLDNGSRQIFTFLMNILSDITGTHRIRDLHFFLSVSNALNRNGCGFKCPALDKYFFQKIFFIKYREGITIQQLMEFDGCFSDDAMKRWYHDPIWNRLKPIPMNSRVALCYQLEDPLRLIQNEMHHDNVIANDVSISQNLSNLLEPFARPLRDVDVYMWATDITELNPEILKTDLEGGINHVFVNGSAIPVSNQREKENIDRKIQAWQHSYRFGDGPRNDFAKVFRMHGNLDHENVCISFSKWLKPPGVGELGRHRYWNNWIIPGCLITCYEVNGVWVEARIEDPETNRLRQTDAVVNMTQQLSMLLPHQR
jgi:hypothetical protein